MVHIISAHKPVEANNWWLDPSVHQTNCDNKALRDKVVYDSNSFTDKRNCMPYVITQFVEPEEMKGHSIAEY